MRHLNTYVAGSLERFCRAFQESLRISGLRMKRYSSLDKIGFRNLNRRSARPDKLLLEAERYEARGDLRNAFKSLLAGALLEDSGCQSNLGNFYSSGKGVRRSLEKAAYWYKRAYKNGAAYAA